MALIRNRFVISILAGFVYVTLSLAAFAVEPHTGFQTWQPWKQELHLPADVVFVYSADANTIKSWQDHGYETWVMLGASWLSKDTDVVVQHPEIKQTTRDGVPFEMIPGRAWVVPVQPWIDWFNARVDQALAAGARGILPEEPEFWASTGYSDSFKQAWQDFYGAPWRPPHESLENHWLAAQLKAHLFTEFFRQVCAHTKQVNPSAVCLVPAHSNLNYTDWNIVAPHSAFAALKETDGFIGQVWTGTAKQAHMLGGEPYASTFNYAFLEYNSFAELVRGTNKQAWLLTDPVEDAKGAAWSDLRNWYEDTLIAALLQPGVNRYEVTPWPDRVLLSDDLYGGSRIPEQYEDELFTVWAAQRNIPEQGRWLEPVTTEIGFLTSDTSMWQMGAGMNRFSGLVAPMLAAMRAGIAARVLPAERFAESGYSPEGIKVIVTGFDAWKPLSHDIVAGLARWVMDGGTLLFLGGADAYDDMPLSWWRGMGYEAPSDALLADLGLSVQKRKTFMPNVVEGFDTAAMVARQTRTLAPESTAPEPLKSLGEIPCTLPITAYAVRESRVLFTTGGKPVTWEAPSGKGHVVFAGFAGEFIAARPEGVETFLSLLRYSAESHAGITVHSPDAFILERPPFIIARGLNGSRDMGAYADLLNPGTDALKQITINAGNNYFLIQPETRK